ncbi:MAG: hypothetical protein WEB00_14645 [Dehalococcoidia bacterium]
MAERVLFVPSWIVSPQGCETIPASRYALNQFRQHFEVDVFTWPLMKAGPKAPPTWEGAVSALREAFEPGCHLVTMETATPATLMALNGYDEDSPVRSWSNVGIAFSPATLRSLNMAALASAAEAGSLFAGSYQFVRHTMQGAGEAEWRRFSELLDEDIDWNYVADFRRSYDNLDLIREQPHVTRPTLYLDKPASRSTFGAAVRREVFQGFAPGCEVRDLRAEFGNQLQDGSTGRDLSQPSIEFIQRVASAV